MNLTSHSYIYSMILLSKPAIKIERRIGYLLSIISKYSIYILMSLTKTKHVKAKQQILVPGPLQLSRPTDRYIYTEGPNILTTFD